ncbi:gliding motility-associated C-terminal domain-containing protein [Flavobacterium sp. FlaQc-52]|uniref:Ig-like domain-containing protein n=1 Tax=Flavobacterium sp. FlaQc-52 TaxID=3374185 RepID=UPI0037578A36
MKKNFTFYDLHFMKRLLGLLFLLFLCNKTFAQTFCRPVSQTNGISGICVGSSITNPTAAFDNDPGLTTFTTMNTVVGVLCSVQETMVLNQTAKAGDEIVFYIGNGSGLLSLGLLSTGTIQAKLNGTNAGPSVAMDSPLLNLSLLPGNTTGILKFKLTSDANQVQIQLGGVLSALVNLRIYDVRLEFADPTVTGGLSQTVCSGNSITLTAAPSVGTTLAWYDSATSTTALIGGNSFSSPVLTANTTYYIGVTRAAGCESNERIPVVVNVSNPVAPVISTTGTAICSSGSTQQTTLSVINPILGTTYNWYTAASAGTLLASGSSYSPTVSVGTTSFYVEAVIGSCLSSTRTQVDVVSTAVPALPTVLTQSVTIQSGQNAILSATSSEPGVTINWYDVATGGTVLASNSPTFTTPVLTATKTYYAEAQSATGGCVSSTRVPVLVTVISTPPGSCLQANSQVTTLNGLCLLCTSTNPNNSVDGSATTAAQLTVPVGLVNGWVQQTLQFNNPGKTGDIVDVDLELPSGLLDLSLLNYISLATYNGATFNNDRVSINNIVSIQLLGGNKFRASVTAGANFDRVEVRLGGLATLLTSVNIYQAAYRYKVPTVTGNTTICSGQTTTLTAGLAVGETIAWFDALTGGNLLASTASYTTPALTSAVTNYIQITRNGCVNSERSAVQVLIDNPLAPIVAAVPASICSGQTSTITIQSPVLGTIYKWYDAAAAGTLLFTGTSFVTPNLTANTSYYIEAGINSCISALRTQVDVTVNPLPAAPIAASSNVIIQSGQSVSLQVSSPEPNVEFDWYDAAVGGTLLATATSTYVTPVLTANTTYYVTARGLLSSCISSVRTPINVVVSASISSCLQANSEVVTKGGTTICLLCSSNNDGNAADGDVTTASTLNIPLGLLGDHIEQTLTFTTSGQSGDIIDVELGIPTGLLDISLLSNITLQSFNSGVPNSDQISISSLVDIQLLGGNRFKASFTAGGAFTSVRVQLNGLATVLTSLNIYDASFRYKNATVTGASSPICSGQTATLNASTTAIGETFKWFDSATGGIELSALASYTTPSLTASTTYYLEATRGGCINTVREPITVTVSPFATAANITIASPVEASCAGVVTLSPTSALVGAQFKYYGDQAKTIPILDAGTGGSGETYAINPTTYALTVSGLTAGASPYSYFISVVNATNCENEAGNLKEVTVTYPTTTALTLIAVPLQGCGSVNLKDAIVGFDTSGNTTYTFYDPSNAIITADAAASVSTSGVYSIQAQGNGITCPSSKQTVTVTINALPTLVVTPSISVNTGSNVALNAVSDGTLAWFDPQGNALVGPAFETGVLNTPGIYTYTVVASNANCTRTGTVSINVIDLNSCQSLTERVYATTQTFGFNITGGVSNPGNAVDGSTKTYSTITTGIGLLGVGTTWQDLKWPANIVKGTPVTVKLGTELSLLALGQNLSVIGTKNGVNIGTFQTVSGSLLNLLSGDSAFEFTFVPSDGTGPQDYDGIKIQMASLVSVAQSTKVYDAYYTRSVSTVACTPGDIQDIYYGAVDLGVGALTATVGVSDAWNVADNDISTFATMYSGVGALAAADLTVAFKTPSIVSDTLRIVISKPGTILAINLLTGFTIQRYLGDVAVGAPIDNTSTLLSLKLLAGDSMAIVLVNSQPEPYDRVRIRFGGVAGVLDNLRVHTVDRVANTKVVGGDINNKVTVCPGTAVTLQIPEVACSTYKWYDAPTGGNVVATGISYTIPTTLAAGIYKYYIQPVRYNCEAFTRGEVTVEVRASSPVNALTNITLNGGAVTSICSPSGTVTLATGLSGTPVLTNPIYYWYSFDGTTSQLIAGETTAQLIVNGLTPGTYTYYVGVSSDELCETAAIDRKQITFTILPPSIKTDILVDGTSICHNVPASLTPTAPTLTNALFTWYLDANKTQPITNGAVIGGVTYAISGTGVLTATGLTKALSPIIYYVAVSSDGTCENIAGTLQEATIVIIDPNTPTTTDTTQDFCLINAPTFASIQVNESNVVWYNVATGGTAFAPTAALTSGVYYGAVLDLLNSCESSVRLQVTISVTDPGTPTTTDTTQDFCLVNAPTFASIQTNQANVVWYSVATGGVAIAPTTALTSGIYFAALLDATTGCQSNVRLQVTISVTDPGTPTTTDTTQDFCLVNAPTFASIQTNQPNVVWYSVATGGTAIAPTTALTSGTYYAALLDATTGCQSNVRLLVTISVTDPGTPTTTDTTQDFCLVNAPTFASIQTNQANVVWYSVVTGGTAIAPTTALTTGVYYAALLDATTGCQSNERLRVTISVTDPGTPTTTDTTQDFCLVNAPTFASIQTNQANVVWYSVATGGVAIAPTTALTSGTYYAALLDATTGCQSNVRLLVTISVTDPGTPTTTDTTQDFCLVNAPTFASIQTNQPNVVWYSVATGGVAIAPTTALTSGTYYAALLDATTGCQSNVRLLVTISVTDPGTPTTTDTTQDFCLINAPTFASIQTNQANVVWYSVVTGGTAIAPTTALTSGVYYAALLDATTGCQSNERLRVTISVTDPGTPTTTDTTQDFCLVNAPTFASIQTNQPNVVWYSVVTGGTAIAPTTALTSGVYYAALLDATTGCQSNERLRVTISVTDPGTPTTTDTTQDFCLVNAPTFASIQTNQPNVIWYSVVTGGTAIAPTTALTSGVYYAALLDATTGCQSNERLRVTISVTDPGTPTTTDTTQDFCLVNAPTFASIQTNQANVVWYSVATGGTVIAPTTALTSGTYYAALLDATTGCQSAVRLQVAISVTDPGTPTLVTAGTQNFCLVNAPTFASIQTTQANVVWYSVATGGIAIAPATALTSGTYYAALLDATTGCQSAVRLQVTISVTDPGTPTTTDTTQDFCLANAPTFASIQTNQANVVWYSVVTGGAAIAPTTALTSGVYYAALLDATTGCQSNERLRVTISVTDPGTPTTTDATQDFCLVNAPTFASIQVNEPNVVWYNATSGGTAFAPTAALTSGIFYGGIVDPVTGCQSAVRLQVTISVTDPGTPTTTDATQDFCLANAPTFASIQTNQANVIWYSVATGGTAIAPTTSLTSGVYYAALLNATTGCQSAVRLQVTISVTDPGTPTLVTAGTQNFCLINAPTFASIQTTQANVVWYSAATGGTAIAPATALTSGTYYAALLDATTGCQSAVRLQVTISVTDPGTPTTTDTTQDFCLINAPTFASIQTNETNVVWYSVATGGTAIAPTTALTSGVYYAALLDATTGCQSKVRLQVIISVTNPGTPTTTDTTQDFCLVNAPTFASIQTNQTNVVWYSVATGGTAIAPTTALTSGTYYAALLNAITGCQSTVRLQVAISVTDPGTPTTTDATQDFCLVNAPTFASIQTNETNVVWYSVATGGTAIAPATALTSGTYYAALLDATTGCQSAVRLQVAISVTDPGTPTLVTAGTQNFCLINAPTFASIQTTQTNVVWYSAATGGTAIAPTTALTSGVYYAALLDATTGCQSAVRLQVTISVTDPGTPTLVNAGTQNFCLINAPTFASIQTNQANVVWYSVATGGTAIAPATALTSGVYYAALVNTTTGCQSAVRLQVTISVTDPGTPTTTDTTQDFCLIDAPTFASIQTNQANVVWYSTATGGTAIAPATALTSGVYYAALLDATTGCQSAVRLQVTISVTDPGTPTLVNAGTQNFCLVNAPTFASIQTTQTNVVWYSTATGGTAIAPTTALTSGVYYAALVNTTTGCQSAVRLQVTISVTDPGTPTLVNAGTQNFCLVNAPTFASIQTTQANVVWYNAATGGTAIAPATALTSGVYYAALVNTTTGCQSAVRLQVTISVTDPGTPTTTDTTQDFCLINAPTFASIQTNQTNVVWYSTVTGGTAIAPATALTSGTYYAALLDATTGCQSAVRLQVTISVTDPGTPSLVNAGTQNFCLINAPTFASIQTNQANVVWYSTATGGTAIAPATALTSGVYYAALVNTTTGCQSAVRLQVTISVTDPGTPTLVTAGTQNFCLINAPTFASIQTTQTNVVWYSTATGGTAIAPATALTSGVYYATLLDATTGCQSAVRLQVTISVTDPGTPTLVTAGVQNFCLLSLPTFASIKTNQANVVWYSTAVGGTVIPLTTLLTTGTYYGAILDPVTGCASANRLQVQVTVGAPNNPTTPNSQQVFCSTAAATVADIVVNETNVAWFYTVSGGTPIPANTLLTTQSYYGAIYDATNGCESLVRLQVRVTVVQPSPKPTTGSVTQNFCIVDAPTVASIQVNEPNVVWYSTPAGGTIIPSTTALTSGSYYGAVLSAVNCENPDRLEVIVDVNSQGIITTSKPVQTFCLSANPTIEDIEVNETGAIWYTSATGGTVLPAGTLLVAGTYYATAQDNMTNGCNNAVRLAVVVNFSNDDLVLITASDDTPCVFDGVTYSIANGKSNYVWSITNGTILSGGGASDGSVTVSWSDIGPGKVEVAYLNTCNDNTYKSLDVIVATCSDLTISNVVSNPTANFGDTVMFTIVVGNVGMGNFINVEVNNFLPAGYRFIGAFVTSGVYTASTGMWSIPTLNSGQTVKLEITAEVLPPLSVNTNKMGSSPQGKMAAAIPADYYLDVAKIVVSMPLDVNLLNNTATATITPTCLTVYNEFTPNSDGLNDFFRIDCIQTYPDNELKVFNRYGALVYSKRNYENTWDGTANVSGVVNRGDMLPTGTYFYVIDTGDGTIKKGWLSIMR